MKTKKLNFKAKIVALLFLLTIIPTAYALAISCYEAWLAAFHEANTEYYNDIANCEETYIPFGAQLCLTEAEMSYGQSLDQAADEYYKCIGG